LRNVSEKPFPGVIHKMDDFFCHPSVFALGKG
jgi:hypothetical protein